MQAKPNHGSDDPNRTQEKMPGRVEDPDRQRGTEWTVPEGDPKRNPPQQEPPRRKETDPEKKVFGVEHATEPE